MFQIATLLGVPIAPSDAAATANHTESTAALHSVCESNEMTTETPPSAALQSVRREDMDTAANNKRQAGSPISSTYSSDAETEAMTEGPMITVGPKKRKKVNGSADSESSVTAANTVANGQRKSADQTNAAATRKKSFAFVLLGLTDEHRKRLPEFTVCLVFAIHSSNAPT